MAPGARLAKGRERPARPGAQPAVAPTAVPAGRRARGPVPNSWSRSQPAEGSATLPGGQTWPAHRAMRSVEQTCVLDPLREQPPGTILQRSSSKNVFAARLSSARARTAESESLHRQVRTTKKIMSAALGSAGGRGPVVQRAIDVPGHPRLGWGKDVKRDHAPQGRDELRHRRRPSHGVAVEMLRRPGGSRTHRGALLAGMIEGASRQAHHQRQDGQGDQDARYRSRNRIPTSAAVLWKSSQSGIVKRLYTEAEGRVRPACARARRFSRNNKLRHGNRAGALAGRKA